LLSHNCYNIVTNKLFRSYGFYFCADGVWP
jgi:hypothetical protein